MYAWGETGFLFHGENPVKPKKVNFHQAENIVSVGCGYNHTLFLMNNGSIFIHVIGEDDVTETTSISKWFHRLSCRCVSSDSIQSLSLPLKQIDSLKGQKIIDIDCGASHVVVLNNHNEVFTWSLDDDYVSPMQPMLPLLTHKVIQIACGAHHTMILTNDGILFTWGNNEYGQLGIGTQSTEFFQQPQEVVTFSFLPVDIIACGGYHSCILTKLGAVFTWGRNNSGQLGHGDQKNRTIPTHCTALQYQKIKFIACGENHTVTLSETFQIYTFGNGSHGQLGHKDFHDRLFPQLLYQLRNCFIIQIACGRNHTLAYSAKENLLYYFGPKIMVDSDSKETNDVNKQKRKKSRSPPVSIITLPNKGIPEQRVLRIFAGGNQNFAKIILGDGNPADFRFLPPEQKIMTLHRGVWVFPSSKTSLLDAVKQICKLVSSPACLNGSFITNGNGNDVSPISKKPNINMEEVRDTFLELATIKHSTMKDMLQTALELLIVKLNIQPVHMEALRVYMMIPECQFFHDPTCFLTVAYPFATAILQLSFENLKILEDWWNHMDEKFFINVIDIYRKVIAYIIQLPSPKNRSEDSNRSKALMTSLLLLERLNNMNLKNGYRVSYEQFYIPEIAQHVDIVRDYLSWFNEERRVHSFCNYPFVLDAAAKTLLLQADASVQKHYAVEEAMQWNLVSFFIPIPINNPYLHLIISRERIIEDTIDQLLTFTHGDLKKPLKVSFVGEEAIDDGGVRKEFFLLIMKEILHPKYGMFKECETKNVWFTSHFHGDEGLYYIVGILCGLAIYNGNVIAVPFPLVLYKKLLAEPIGLQDIKDLSPLIQRGLQELLEYENDDIHEVYGLYFEISWDNYGDIVTEELKAGGSKIPVTYENKEEYVDLYVNYMLYKSVAIEFNMFYEGFHRVCGSRILQMFRAPELMAMMIGNENYDWNLLEKYASYRGGYSRLHPVIRWFWRVFHKLDDEQKIKFLLFLTGSDRVPILGMKSIPIIIQKSQGGENYLPVAHTCFNLLHLPAYSSEKLLKAKLLQAIEQTHGFGLV